MRALLISTYDLGRQPFGLASPAAWLRRDGVDVTCVDLAKQRLEDDEIRRASLVGLYLPMHTATRLAAPVIDRVRRVNPDAELCAFGLYAVLNDEWLRGRGVTHVLGGEFEEALVAVATNSKLKIPHPQVPESKKVPRLAFLQPDRSSLPPLAHYAMLHLPDGTRRVAGATEASRGCKHLCRHCPIVPVYKGQFRIVPVDIVMADVRAQVKAGAEHISFGDPDFFNGPTHARRIVERLAADCPGVTYDVTIKIEHVLQHVDMLRLLRDTGCLFITSAVESVDDAILLKLAKGHTREGFTRAALLCSDAGVTLVPTFVPFTPWTTLDGYIDLLQTIEALDLVEQVAPIQLAIRLLVTSGSPLLALDEIRSMVQPFDAASLTWPWRHADARVDRLQCEVMQLVGVRMGASREATFAAISALANDAAGRPLALSSRPPRDRATVPYLNEPWYC